MNQNFNILVEKHDMFNSPFLVSLILKKYIVNSKYLRGNSLDNISYDYKTKGYASRAEQKKKKSTKSIELLDTLHIPNIQEVFCHQ